MDVWLEMILRGEWHEEGPGKWSWCTVVRREDNPNSWTPVWHPSRPKNLGSSVLELSSHGSMGLSWPAKPGHYFTSDSLLIPRGSYLSQASTHKHWIPLRENVKMPWAVAQGRDRILGSGFYRDSRISHLQSQLRSLKRGLWKDIPLLPTSEQKRN